MVQQIPAQLVHQQVIQAVVKVEVWLATLANLRAHAFTIKQMK